MEYNLFLDDFRMPEDTFNYMPLPIYNIVDWHIVRSYQAFIDYIQYAGVPKIISFDHDLGALSSQSTRSLAPITS